MNRSESQTSRRVFLKTAMAAAGTTAVGARTRARADVASPDRARLERLLKEYGSEIGGLRRVVGES